MLAAALALVATPLSAAPASAATSVQHSPVLVFQPAGDVGPDANGEHVLDPGTLFPPTSAQGATLKRGSDWMQVNIQTSGLPAGAYTVWWIIFNTPSGCSPTSDPAAPSDCGEDDLEHAITAAMDGPGGVEDPTALSVFWATGGVVGGSGVRSFHDRHRVDDSLGEPGQQHILGSGALDPQAAEVHNVIKYHGPASSDPDLLYGQTHTLLGSCEQGANAHQFPAPFGLQCFDPQAVVFLAG